MISSDCDNAFRLFEENVVQVREDKVQHEPDNEGTVLGEDDRVARSNVRLANNK